MHTGNVVVAWVTTAQDRLQGAVRAADLDLRELAALTLIAEHEGCSLEWLRVRVALTQSGTVRLVDRLAARSLLRRGHSTGRGVPLHLTGEGAARLTQWREARDAVVEELLAGMPYTLRGPVVDAMAAALLVSSRRRAEADATCRSCSWAACGDDCPVDGSVAVEDET
ncbi:MarR family transcriptional regulator [Asanoa siamensis]|uniref:HTH marR-type domain-containing protein n=1 Tax=Asanoa siamensis TaxID=926357 RepID=A0ABQ4D2T2_9ACTN|nr:MarR family transcriptional regulator [Asanoa siamensis]GIF77826.1 hypothetical protein Asi02nite_73440 [Asanoa siamensis]